MTETHDDSTKTAGAHLPTARSVERRERQRARAQQVPKRMARTFVELPKKTNPGIILAVLVVLVVLALSLATPLRNYFDQRTELANIEAKIEKQEARKAELTDELNRYNNDDYVKEQARIRLGVIEPGESAFRIISPKIGAEALEEENPSGNLSEAEEAYENSPWFVKLWDSIAKERPESSDDPDEPGEEMRVPTLPEQPEHDAPAEEHPAP